MKQIKNKPASILSKLKNIARKEGIDYNLILTLYAQSGFLYRLSISPYVDNFLLKGGLLLFSLDKFATRPTKDIDFLVHNFKNDVDTIRNLLLEIIEIKCDDGLNFRKDDLTVKKILEQGRYEGIRAGISYTLGKTRNRLQIDIGFGDVVIPKPVNLEFPVLLETQQIPIIKAYSLESTIAEKFEAMIALSFFNSRMKDFYDIYILSKRRNFDGRVLQEAIMETFQRRGTPIERNHPIFQSKFIHSPEKQLAWSSFRKRVREKTPETFDEIMKQLITFLLPIYNAICDEEEYFLKWDASSSRWL